MKTTVKIIIVALFLMTAASFAQNNIPSGKKKTDIENSGLIGKVKEMTELIYGVELQSDKQVQGAIQNWTVYQYNQNGNIILETHHSPTGQFEFSIANTYDDKGNILESNKKHADTILNSIRTFTYNDKGQLYEDPDFFGEITTIKYDNNGNMVKSEKFLFGSWMSERIYQYDEKGNNTGYTTETGRYSFKYDAKGNVIEQNEYDSNDSVITKRIFKYHLNGKKMEENYKDNRGYNFTNKYNNEERILQKMEYGSVEVSRFEYIYDNQGNWIKRTEFKNDYKTDDPCIIIREIKYY